MSRYVSEMRILREYEFRFWLLVVVVLLVIQFIAFLSIKGYRNWKIYQWFKKKKAERDSCSAPPEEKEI